MQEDCRTTHLHPDRSPLALLAPEMMDGRMDIKGRPVLHLGSFSLYLFQHYQRPLLKLIDTSLVTISRLLNRYESASPQVKSELRSAL